MVDTTRLEGLVDEQSRRLEGARSALDPLVDRLAQARLVLLGEASHGTEEFYRFRATLSRRLIDEHGFGAVLVEADWPDAYRVNRWVQLSGDDATATAALGDFERFPRWMWRNRPVAEFISWLRRRNADFPTRERTGFYGFDLYSLHRSMNAVIDYLEGTNPEAALRARKRYACFDHFGADAQSYGLATGRRRADNCEEEVVRQLVDLERERARMTAADGLLAEDEFFFAEQNARVVRNAEQYYRTMYRGRASSWNVRDQHMAETVTALVNHLEHLGRPSKAIVWAHNSHLGDARATSMSDRGEHNVGQLLRQRYGDQIQIVGFTTDRGTVTAASRWGAAGEFKRVRPGREESLEALFHRCEKDYFYLDLGADAELTEALAEPRYERAIGVIYRPETEFASHYFRARLSEQFDWVVHMDATCALRPLEPATVWSEAAGAEPDLPETYPFGL